MEEKTEKICRLCFRIILDGYFQLIENIRGLLEELQFDLNVSISEKPIVCHDCTIMLQKYHDFKISIKAEIALTSFVNSTDTYLNEPKREKCYKTAEDQILCRFCMKIVVTDHVSKETGIQEDTILKNMLRTCVPELDANFADRSTICKPCFESLQNVFQFKMNCFDIEKKIKMYCEVEGMSSKGKVNLYKVFQYTSNIKMGDANSENIETGCKNEKETCNSDTLMKCQQQNANLNDNLNLPVNKENTKIESETVQKDNGRFVQGESKCKSTNKKSKEARKISKKNYKHKRKIENTTHTCQLCPFETKKRTYLITHMLIHKDPSEIKMHKCNLCPFQSKYKSNFNVHLLKHKNSSIRNIYKCQLCMYDTHIEYRFNTHMLLHNKSSEVAVPETQCKDELDSRIILQKEPPESPIYKCELCVFETKQQDTLKNHILTHEKPAVMGMYRCEVCTFETDERDTFDSHKIIHKNTSNIITYKCLMCNYESEYKGDLRKHFLMHKTSSKMTLYKCDLCVYQTKRIGNMKAHIITHKKASETNMYKCSKCNFQTKYRANFRTHLLKHKDMSEVVTHMCDKCTYVTKHKGDLNRHIMIHNKA